jgi:hypothetical protein
MDVKQHQCVNVSGQGAERGKLLTNRKKPGLNRQLCQLKSQNIAKGIRYAWIYSIGVNPQGSLA